jgi:hypothetical protein
VVIYGAACSYCLARAERLEGSYLRTFAVELKQQLAQTLAAFVTLILAGPRKLDGENVAEPPLRQIIEVLLQVMDTHDAEKHHLPSSPSTSNILLANFSRSF